MKEQKPEASTFGDRLSPRAPVRLRASAGGPVTGLLAQSRPCILKWFIKRLLYLTPFWGVGSER